MAVPSRRAPKKKGVFDLLTLAVLAFSSLFLANISAQSFVSVAQPAPVDMSMCSVSYIKLESLPETVFARIPKPDLSLLRSGQLRIRLSASYDSTAGTVVSKLDIVEKDVRTNGGNSGRDLLSFLAAVDRVDSYETPSVRTVVLTGHLTDAPSELRSALPMAAPVVLSFQTGEHNPRKLLDVLEMLPGISFAPTLTSGRVIVHSLFEDFSLNPVCNEEVTPPTSALLTRSLRVAA